MIFKWMNESAISIEGDRIEITAPPRTDFFAEVSKNVKTVFYRNQFVIPHMNVKLLKTFGVGNRK